MYYEECLKQALKEGSLTYMVTTAVVQGEAQVGKTCLKSLILSLPYDEVSTSCIEAPSIAFSVSHFGSIGGKCWKFVSDNEMDDKVIAELQKHVATKSVAIEKNVHVEAALSIQSITTNATNESTIGQNSLSQLFLPVGEPSQEEINYQQDINHQPADANIESRNTEYACILEDEGTETILPEKFDVLEYCKKRCEIDRFGEHREWLYFVDSGGQIQFQKILLAFMPSTSVLILVVNLAKSLSGPSSTSMLLQTESIKIDEHSLSVEEVLKQVLSAIASNAKKFRSQIQNIPCIKLPKNEKLRVISVGTHCDKLEKVKKYEVIEEQKIRLHEILMPLENICDFQYTNNVFQLYEVDGSKAKRGEYEDPAVEKISHLLKENAFEINVPLRWHYFGVILRKKATESQGILKKSSCDFFGKLLDMSVGDVHNALRFFHTLKMLFYYHDSPAKDLVFVKLDSLMNIIKELMIIVHKSRSTQKGLLKQDVKKFADKGYLSIEILESCDSVVKITSSLNSKDFSRKLLGLFEHLKIAAKLSEERKFLMPALLPVRNISDRELLPNTIPLLFYFNNAVPMGLFCAVIVHLLSSDSVSANTWRITSSGDNFSNFFTLQKNIDDSEYLDIVLVEKLYCIEIYCKKTDVRIKARRAIEAAITGVMKDKLIDYEKPILVFYCPCHAKNDHVARVEHPFHIICELSNEGQKLAEFDFDEYCSWFMDRQAITDMKRRKRKDNHSRNECKLAMSIICTSS